MSASQPSAAAEHLRARIERSGRLSFEEFVDAALYHPDGGFFASGGGAGRHRDFLTSPEVGPLFGAVLARALDVWWDDLGRPDPFVVVDAGAGSGTLARSVLGAEPDCARALRYLLVETSAALRSEQEKVLPLELPAFALGPALVSDEDEPVLVPGIGPITAALAELPASRFNGIVIANELLDNLPFALLARTPRGWDEVRVDWDGARFVEALVAAPPGLVAEAERLVPDAPRGSRIPLQHRAQAWLRHALRLVSGRVVVIDYATDTAVLAARPWEEWLRTYRGGGPGRHPLDDVGAQDITCEVAVDQLARVRPPDVDQSQTDFLRSHGLDDLVGDARAVWLERAATGDLEALAARSRVSEGEALVDPAGLGAFRVLEWVRK